MLSSVTPITDWLGIIHAEFLEIPGLCLTKPQVQRLWRLDPVTAEALLTALVDVRFLKHTPQGAYMRADVG